ncbi:MAG: hypothetical protein IJW18_01425 [Lachnospiraceae bacterium]|nr:hypothetical protein [Lachnospiraceae bacterium]
MKKAPWWIIGVMVGIVFLIIGFGREQFDDIYNKAIMICLECIGIG